MVSPQKLPPSPQQSKAAPRPKSRSNDLRHHVMSIMILSGGIFALIAAFLARSGFTGRQHGTKVLPHYANDRLILIILPLVIGIDLGTTYSVVAISQRNNVSIIPDRYQHTLIPSIVTFLPHGGSYSIL